MPRVGRQKLRQDLKSQVCSVTLLVDVKKPRIGNTRRLKPATLQLNGAPRPPGRFSLSLDEVVSRAEIFQLSSLEGCVLDTHDMFAGLKGRNMNYPRVIRELIKQQRF